MAEPGRDFIEYQNKYLAFTGKSIEPSDKESMELFFQFVQLNILIDLKSNLAAQQREIKELVTQIKNFSK
mgnify:CR=1 FL=1